MNSERAPDATGLTAPWAIQLLPTEPPGRATRKARRFEAQIARLRTEGYSLAAIRRALAGAGVQVSISTVRREAIRSVISAATVAGAPGLASVLPQTTGTDVRRPADALGSAALPEVSGKDQAEAFLRRQITNPLLRMKEVP